MMEETNALFADAVFEGGGVKGIAMDRQDACLAQEGCFMTWGQGANENMGRKDMDNASSLSLDALKSLLHGGFVSRTQNDQRLVR